MTSQPENPAPEQAPLQQSSGSGGGPPHYGQAPAPHYGQAPTPQFTPQQAVPTNGFALASIITSSLSMATLFFTAGLASPLTAIASIVGAVLGHKGKDDVDKGRAFQQRDLAVAGMWVGVAGIVLSVLALIAWVALIVVMVAFDDTTWMDEVSREFEGDWDRR